MTTPPACDPCVLGLARCWAKAEGLGTVCDHARRETAMLARGEEPATTYRDLVRERSGEPPLPSLPRQALNYAKAEVRDVAAGRPRLDKAAVAARLAVCRGDAEAGIPACDQYRAADDRCSHRGCGCYLGGDGGKAVRSVESCPLGKWPI